MKAVIVFAGTGPILILTSYDSMRSAGLIAKLSSKGIRKFIAYEVSEALVHEKYGQHFDVVMGDLYQTDDLRVLDYDGHHVFHNFTFEEMGTPFYHEAED